MQQLPLLPASLNDNFEEAYDIIQYGVSLFSYYQKPNPPKQKSYPDTADGMLNYVNALKTWEAGEQEREEEKAAVAEHNLKVQSLLKEFICSQANIRLVPEQYREKVWNHAWVEGHSSGWYDVYLILLQLVEIFE